MGLAPQSSRCREKEKRQGRAVAFRHDRMGGGPGDGKTPAVPSFDLGRRKHRRKRKLRSWNRSCARKRSARDCSDRRREPEKLAGIRENLRRNDHGNAQRPGRRDERASCNYESRRIWSKGRRADRCSSFSGDPVRRNRPPGNHSERKEKRNCRSHYSLTYVRSSGLKRRRRGQFCPRYQRANRKFQNSGNRGRKSCNHLRAAVAAFLLGSASLLAADQGDPRFEKWLDQSRKIFAANHLIAYVRLSHIDSKKGAPFEFRYDRYPDGLERVQNSAGVALARKKGKKWR